MTLLLGVIAAVLLIAIVAVILKQNHDDEVLGFHRPEDLQAALVHNQRNSIVRPADAIRTAPTGPQTIDSIPLDQIMAGNAVVAQSSPDSFYPGNLGLGTLLTYRGATSEIVGIVSFEFKGELWQDYIASNTTGEWWRLGVEPDRGMKLAAFMPHPILVEPGPETITVDDKTYSVLESGQARYRTIGETNQFEEGKYWFYDYGNTEGVILSYERFDNGPWVTSVGHRVDPHAVQVNNAGSTL